METEKQYRIAIVSIQEVNLWFLWTNIYDEMPSGKQQIFVKIPSNKYKDI